MIIERPKLRLQANTKHHCDVIQSLPSDRGWNAFIQPQPARWFGLDDYPPQPRGGTVTPWMGGTLALEAIMKIGTVLPAVAAVLVFGSAPSLSLASTTSPESSQPATPNSCIERNQGDFNACNVGSSGRGDLPYRPIATPNSCIERNQGDFKACNVGNSGRGDLPYRPASR